MTNILGDTFELDILLCERIEYQAFSIQNDFDFSQLVVIVQLLTNIKSVSQNVLHILFNKTV